MRRSLTYNPALVTDWWLQCRTLPTHQQRGERPSITTFSLTDLDAPSLHIRHFQVEGNPEVVNKVFDIRSESCPTLKWVFSVPYVCHAHKLAVPRDLRRCDIVYSVIDAPTEASRDKKENFACFRVPSCKLGKSLRTETRSFFQTP